MSTQVSVPPTNDRLPPAVRVWKRLLRARAATARALSTALQREHGLSISDYEALSVLSFAHGRRMKRVELARALVLSPSAVTRLLEGLEATGLVERAACSGDLRVTYAQLTDAGAERLERASCAHVGSVRALFE